MKPIYFFLIGAIITLIGAYFNPMNWYDNFKGEPSITISITNILLVIGLLICGMAVDRMIVEVQHDL